MDTTGKSGACPVSVTATAKPNTANGYTFNRWSGDSSSTSRTITVTATASARTKSVTATFTPPQCSVSVSAGTGGSVNTSGRSGACPVSVTATANPDTANGYTFNRWSGDSSSTSRTITVTATASARTKSVTATFTPPQCTLSVSASGGGSAAITSGSATGACGRSVTIRATASAGYKFNTWSGDVSGKSNPTTVTVTKSSMTARASFNPVCTVVPATSKGGTVSGGGTVVCGTAVPIHASANAGHCFSHWNQLIAPGDFAQATSSVCLTRHTFNVPTNIGTRNQVFQAIFRAKRSYTLTVVGGSGSGSYLEGTYATAKAPAGKCFLGTAYIFKRWSGDSTSTSRVISVRMNSNKSVTAVFSVAGTCPFAQAEEGEAAPHVADDP